MKKIITTIIVIVICIAVFKISKPLVEVIITPAYHGANNFRYEQPKYDSSLKTIVIVANNEGTELFDMMAPYYLFNTTLKANVYIVAKKKVPIVVNKGIYVVPQSTFSEMDASGIKPDVIVIPFLEEMDSIHQDPVIVNWIKKHYTASTMILSICDGAATAAATGIFDGKPITAHASDFATIKAKFRKPVWIKNVGVVHTGNLYSTAGVSNATEGSLLVINDLFGADIMEIVRQNIHYPHPFPRISHRSVPTTFSDRLYLGKKILFHSNKKIGVMLNDGMNEFDLASVMDTYNRTFPGSIKSFSLNNQPVKTKFGLIIIPTGKSAKSKFDEFHIFDPDSFSEKAEYTFNSSKIVKYDNSRNEYRIDECLLEIKTQYGERFERVVKLLLDYN
jgi:putative intracellular protease/amidase